eukprot:7253923-Prymnesium_polylepis.1
MRRVASASTWDASSNIAAACRMASAASRCAELRHAGCGGQDDRVYTSPTARAVAVLAMRHSRDTSLP